LKLELTVEVPDDQEVPGGLPLQKGGVANGNVTCIFNFCQYFVSSILT